MKNSVGQRPVRVGLISLGCAKNLVDAEIMLGSLLQSGMAITNDPRQADVLLVNTCSFIDAAQEESIDAILESAELREAHNPSQGLIVSGCLPQRFREELPKLLPEVDAFMGIDQVAQVSDIVQQALQRRAERLALPSSKVKVQRAKIKRRLGLAKLDPARARPSHENERNTPAGEKFGQTNLVPPSTALRATSPRKEREEVTGLPAPSSPQIAVHARPTYIPDYATPRFRLTPRHFAYVKIAEGCNHPCSFCIIPRMRGSHRSRAQADIIEEARQLIADGVKELNLISQDSTYYGLDLRPNRAGSIAAPQKFQAAAQSLPSGTPTLSTLLRELNDLPGDFWIRLLYTHPAHWTDELISTMAACPKVARYVDMPLQHIHHNMLERMRRETSQQYIVDLVKKIRAGLPGIALRTTFIVGFPGETDAYFQTLLDFIRDTKFERLGVFTYSREEGTRAGQMAGQLPEGIKRQRRDLAMTAQHEVARQVSASFVGRTLKVLVEKEARAHSRNDGHAFSWEHGLIRDQETRPTELDTQNLAVARSEADAPDIDGRVYVRGPLPVGEFASVRITGYTDYDLVAEPA